MNLYKKIIIGFAGCMIVASCDGYLDINDSPNNPTTVDAKYYHLLPFSQFYASNSYTITASNSSYYCGQIAASANAMQLGATKWDFSAGKRNNTLQQWWFVFCGSNMKNMYEQAIEAGAYHYAAAAKFLRASGFMSMTDVFGEIPYSEALGEAVAPKYDTGKTVFMGALAELDEAIELFQRTQEVGAASLATGDSWNDGDVNKWLKMCYLYKARWLNHLTKKGAGSYKDGKYDEAEILSCLAKAQQSNTDNTLIRHTDTNGPTHDEAGWGETVDYSPLFSTTGSNANRYFTTKYFYNNLTNFCGTGVEDPRADKLIPWARSSKSVNTPTEIKWSVDGKWRRSLPIDMQTSILSNSGPFALSYTQTAQTVNGQALTANSWYCNTKNEERWGDTIYVQGRCGSKGYNAYKDLLYRVYPANDGSAMSGLWHCRADAPTFLASYSEACFIKAEVLMRKNDKNGAHTAYREGVKANIDALNDQCKTWVAGDASLNACPSFTPSTDEEIAQFLNGALGAASDITMSKIMTQKQIAMIWTIEQWLDMRRFDYDTSIFLGWDKPFEYRNTPKLLTYMPLDKLPRRWPQASYETGFNFQSLLEIGSQVPGSLELTDGKAGASWYNADKICTLPVWWDSNQE